MGRAKPNLTPDVTPPQASAWVSVFGLCATWGKPEPARITRQNEAPRTGAKIRGEIRLTLTGNLWRALACLYSEVRLYKGARTATPPQSAASHATGNISVGERKSATATHVEQ